MLTKISNFISYHKIKRHAAEIAIAWGLFTGIVLMYDYAQQQARENAPLSEYFEVRQIGIPDFPVGADPVIIYDRTVHRPFNGTYHVEVQEAGTLQPLPDCSHGDVVNYSPEKQLPRGGATLFWFIGKRCDIPPGAYRVEACWNVERYRASTLHYCRPSAIFNVFDPANIQQLIQKSQESLAPTQE